MTIPYRIERIVTNQFAIFPDKFLNKENVAVDFNLNFGVGDHISPLKNTTTVHYTQNGELLLVLEITCLYVISEEGLDAIRKVGRIPVDFLRYMGSFSIGIARGIIHARTEGTVLSPVILPPVNLNTSIDKDLIIKKEDFEKMEK